MNDQPPRHSVSVSGVITDDHGPRPAHPAPRQPPLGAPRRSPRTGESIEDGLRREVREETGLDIEPDTLSGVYKNMNRGIVALVFRCKVTGGQLTTNDEAAAFRWADERHHPPAHQRGLRRPPPGRPPRRQSPAIRSHDGVKLL